MLSLTSQYWIILKDINYMDHRVFVSILYNNKASDYLSMIFRSIYKFLPANIGDSIRVSLPDVDIGRADPRNIISAVWFI